MSGGAIPSDYPEVCVTCRTDLLERFVSGVSYLPPAPVAGRLSVSPLAPGHDASRRPRQVGSSLRTQPGPRWPAPRPKAPFPLVPSAPCPSQTSARLTPISRTPAAGSDLHGPPSSWSPPLRACRATDARTAAPEHGPCGTPHGMGGADAAATTQSGYVTPLTQARIKSPFSRHLWITANA
jgi:hypothetical protein